MKKKNNNSDATSERIKQHPAIYAITVVTLVVIVAAFVVFPSVKGLLTPKVVNMVGTYEGTKVTNNPVSLYGSIRSKVYANAKRQYPSLTDDMLAQYFHGQVLSETFKYFGIVTMLEKSGITTSVAHTNDLLFRTCGDYSLGSLFTIDKLRAPSRSNFSKAKYDIARQTNPTKIKVIRKNLSTYDLVETFINDMSALSSFSNNEEKFIKEMGTKVASVKYFKLDETMIDNETLTEYIDENSDDFTSVDIRMIRTEDKKVAKEIQTELFETPELFAERAEVYNSTHYQAEKGKLGSMFISTLAKKLNITNSKNINEIVALEDGEISSTIKINENYYIFKAENSPVEADATSLLLTKKDDIIKEIRSTNPDILQDMIDITANNIQEKSSENGFEETANALNAKIDTIESFPLNYGNSTMLQTINADDASLSTIGSNKEFLMALFSGKKGDILEPITSGLDTFIFLVSDISTATDNDAATDAMQADSALLTNFIKSKTVQATIN